MCQDFYSSLVQRFVSQRKAKKSLISGKQIMDVGFDVKDFISMCHYILKLIRISDNQKIERGMNFSHSILAIFCENLLST